MRWRSALERKLLEVGFTSRAAAVVALHTNIESLEDLQTLVWESERGRKLAKSLSMAPNCGQKVIGEINAFREFGDPRRVWEIAPSHVALSLQPDEVAILDAWILRQSKPLSRSAAIKQIIEASLDRRDRNAQARLGPGVNGVPGRRRGDQGLGLS